MTVRLELDTKSSQKQLTSVADRILSAKRLLFISGAGISCSAGIPDFRSLHGLYDSQRGRNIKGHDLFDISLFNKVETMSLFYKFMADLRDKTLKAEPTPTHRLLKTFKNHGSLLRVYTQNIDGLEDRVGLNLDSLPLKQNDVVQLHGSLHSLRCSLCSQSFAWKDQFAAKLRHGETVECSACADKCAVRMALGRRAVASGTLRPNIVLYGEQHPSSDMIAKASEADLKRKPDCLIVAGTSLKIPGLKRLIKDFAKAVHASQGIVVFVNLTDVATKEWDNIFDFHISGSSDDFVELLRNTRPAFFTKQITLKSCKATKMISSKITKSDRKPILTPIGLAQTKDNIMASTCHTHVDCLRKVSEVVIWNDKENIRPIKRSRSLSDYGEISSTKRLRSANPSFEVTIGV